MKSFHEILQRDTAILAKDTREKTVISYLWPRNRQCEPGGSLVRLKPDFRTRGASRVFPGDANASRLVTLTILCPDGVRVEGKVGGVPSLCFCASVAARRQFQQGGTQRALNPGAKAGDGEFRVGTSDEDPYDGRHDCCYGGPGRASGIKARRSSIKLLKTKALSVETNGTGSGYEAGIPRPLVSEPDKLFWASSSSVNLSNASIISYISNESLIILINGSRVRPLVLSIPTGAQSGFDWLKSGRRVPQIVDQCHTFVTSFAELGCIPTRKSTTSFSKINTI